MNIIKHPKLQATGKHFQFIFLWIPTQHHSSLAKGSVQLPFGQAKRYKAFEDSWCARCIDHPPQWENRMRRLHKFFRKGWRRHIIFWKDLPSDHWTNIGSDWFWLSWNGCKCIHADPRPKVWLSKYHVGIHQKSLLLAMDIHIPVWLSCKLRWLFSSHLRWPWYKIIQTWW